jgi:hypothetical protein
LYTWGISIAIHGRTASIVSDRRTLDILDVSDLGPLEAQDIPIWNFKTTWNSILYSLSKLRTSDICKTSPVAYQLTENMGSFLQFSTLAEFGVEVNTPQEYLRNLFAASLHYFNLIMLNDADPSPYTQQAGIPFENQINGSLAMPVSHLVITRWTVYTYIAVSGLILLITCVYLAISSLRTIPETSEFAVIDALAIRCQSNLSQQQNEASTALEGTFNGIGAGDDGAILRQAKGIVIAQKMRAGNYQQSGIPLKNRNP